MDTGSGKFGTHTTQKLHKKGSVSCIVFISFFVFVKTVLFTDRNNGVGLSSMIARIGGIAAPYVVLLVKKSFSSFIFFIIPLRNN